MQISYDKNTLSRNINVVKIRQSVLCKSKFFKKILEYLIILLIKNLFYAKNAKIQNIIMLYKIQLCYNFSHVLTLCMLYTLKK